MLVLMVSCCYQIGEGTQRAGVGCFIFNLLSLPNTLSIEKIHRAPGAGAVETRKEKGGMAPLIPHFFRSSLGPSPRLTSAWSLGKSWNWRGAQSGQRRPHSPTSNNERLQYILCQGKLAMGGVIPNYNSSKHMTDTKFVTAQLFR